MTATHIPWSSGTWTNEPYDARETRTGTYRIAAKQGSDAWLVTSYGFRRDSENALVTPFGPGSAVEVTFTPNFTENFDQAGIFVKASPTRWVKAGVELSDRHLQLGAVVTDGMSDWSVAPVDEWKKARIRLRVSWSGDALTVRAGFDGSPLRMVRLIPWTPDLATTTQAGPFVASPSRTREYAPLTVEFHEWVTTEADASLH